MDKYLKKIKIHNLLPTIHINSGSMEAIKWIALLSMTIDHLNRFFFDTTIYSAYCAGRLAMPLFAFIFAYNLAQPDALPRGLYSKATQRLLFFGLLATPAYIAMRQDIWPLNIMFTLAAATVSLFFYEQGNSRGRLISFSIFLISGPFVEYLWIGNFFCITAWFYCKRPSITRLLTCLVAYLFLGELNGNHWAVLSLVFIIAATKIKIKLPRIRHFFYYYYPAHLWIMYLIRLTFFSP
ncbi:TraX family protein [Legionella sp.]|uniref:TraX family protein n=1 Tax=Legionella sp. TaxID=459 RepID=UPI003C94FF5D